MMDGSRLVSLPVSNCQLLLLLLCCCSLTHLTSLFLLSFSSLHPFSFLLSFFSIHSFPSFSSLPLFLSMYSKRTFQGQKIYIKEPISNFFPTTDSHLLKVRERRGEMEEKEGNRREGEERKVGRIANDEYWKKGRTKKGVEPNLKTRENRSGKLIENLFFHFYLRFSLTFFELERERERGVGSWERKRKEGCWRNNWFWWECMFWWIT